MIKFKVKSLGDFINKLIKGEAVMDNKHMGEQMRNNIGDITFKEIHDKYKWNLNITVTDAAKTGEARLLNYLTTPNVIVWTAVCASSAIPGFYDPVELLIKTETEEIKPYHPNVT